MANVIIDYSRLHGMIRPYPELCQMYWHLRYCRDWDESGRVKWYRRIRKRKKTFDSRWSSSRVYKIAVPSPG